MKKTALLLTLTFIIALMAACSSDDENTEAADDAKTDSETQEEENEEESEESESEDNGSNLADASSEEEQDTEEEEEEEYEPYEYEEVWADVGLEVESSNDEINSDLEKFQPLLISDTKQDYRGYVSSVLTSVQQEVTVGYHYKRFMNNVPDMLMDLKRVELETNEMDYARQQMIKAYEKAIDTIEPLESEIDDIHDGNFDTESMNELENNLLEVYHYEALACVQLQRLNEEEDIELELEGEDALLDFIDENLIEDKL
ncbi:vacuolar-type H+-ATPase subunit I/STV1 [Salibacterium salarium]|uniref:hypothetical protein n=1 Tax=Salibacterium salarium TaxID=284579 RepID=UPI002789A671|nr:hypothetical protein [Salibacterium salarium]MDQ0300644.1 vacuolar-type H+-ATPase subunit I/STV1 [Salibacterium salarium]